MLRSFQNGECSSCPTRTATLFRLRRVLLKTRASKHSFDAAGVDENGTAVGIPVSPNIFSCSRGIGPPQPSKRKVFFHGRISSRAAQGNRTPSRAAASWMHPSGSPRFPAHPTSRQLMKARAALNSASGIAFNMCLRAGCDELPPHAATGGCCCRKRCEYIHL